jgi:hypothetical protein
MVVRCLVLLRPSHLGLDLFNLFHYPHDEILVGTSTTVVTATATIAITVFVVELLLHC